MLRKLFVVALCALGCNSSSTKMSPDLSATNDDLSVPSDLSVAAPDLAVAGDLAVAADLAWPGIPFDQDAGICPFTPSPGQYDLGGEVCPSCFGDVVLSCVAEGACIKQSTTSSNVTVERICYANGVRVQRTSDSSTRRTTELTYRDGKLCFTASTVTEVGEPYTDTTYYDPCGHAFAFVGLSTPQLSYVRCGGHDYGFPPSFSSCLPNAGAGCTPGICN